uniref:t-SNARE coiled-coil homology domain-containing protein n=1 Tax=Caenorhabditis japonica TaxID=281687 RepID=A0A8R1HRX7_CAEJA
MTRDRLKELREKAGISQDTSSSPTVRRPQSFNNDSAAQPLIDQDADFEMFLERCTNLRGGLKSLEEDYDAIIKLHGELLSTPGADADNSDKLNNHVQMFISKADQVRKSLTILSNETKSLPSSACGISRAKGDQVRTIYKTFETIMIKFNKEQEEYKDKAKSKIVDYLKIRNMQLSDEEIEDAVSSGNLSELTKGVMLALNEKKALYDDVKSRAIELKVLEGQMAELAQMFHDLHILVVSQGEMMDHIETNVESAKGYAHQARGNVEEARRLQKRARKMKVCIIIATIIIVLILLVFFQAAVCHFTPIC